jgi:hypothetical protein
MRNSILYKEPKQLESPEKEERQEKEETRRKKGLLNSDY